VQVQLSGSYPQSHYTIWRASSPQGPYETAITEPRTLCLGSCYGEDRSAEPGATYWYRFDVEGPDGSLVRYGPYPVTISPALARPVGVGVFPNPGFARTRIELHLGGARGEAPLAVEASLHDLQGRVVRTLHRGPLPRGLTALEWDGRDRNGRALEAGCYFLRFTTPLGTNVTRVIRTR
jgi:hypothetical protein